MGKIVKNVTIDATDVYVYSNEIYLQNNTICALGYDLDDDSTTLAVTITLQAEAVQGGGQKADQTDRTAEYDTGWVTLGASHGWDGFPGGDPSGGDTADTVTVSCIGHKKFRLKFERTAGSGTLDADVNVKPNV